MTEEFGTKLKKIRMSRNMSQDDLAKFLGTSKQVISRYETNQRTPKITTAQEYSFKLNVPLLYLVDNNITSIEEVPQHHTTSTNSSNIISTEQELLNKYRMLSSEGKQSVNDYIDFKYMDEMKKSKIKDESAG